MEISRYKDLLVEKENEFVDFTTLIENLSENHLK